MYLEDITQYIMTQYDMNHISARSLVFKNKNSLKKEVLATNY